jgi:hypothetical protein
MASKGFSALFALEFYSEQLEHASDVKAPVFLRGDYNICSDSRLRREDVETPGLRGDYNSCSNSTSAPAMWRSLF